MVRRTEDIWPTIGLPRHIHFVRFSNVPVQAPTRGQPSYCYYEKPSYFSHLLRSEWGYGGPILILNPPGPHGGANLNMFYCYINLNVFLFIILFYSRENAGVYVKNTSSVSPACRKRGLNGAMCRNHRNKRVAPCRCVRGTLKNPANCLWRWEPDRKYNSFFSPPALLCRLIYDLNMLHVT